MYISTSHIDIHSQGCSHVPVRYKMIGKYTPHDGDSLSKPAIEQHDISSRQQQQQKQQQQQQHQHHLQQQQASSPPHKSTSLAEDGDSKRDVQFSKRLAATTTVTATAATSAGVSSDDKMVQAWLSGRSGGTDDNSMDARARYNAFNHPTMHSAVNLADDDDDDEDYFVNYAEDGDDDMMTDYSCNSAICQHGSRHHFMCHSKRETKAPHKGPCRSPRSTRPRRRGAGWSHRKAPRQYHFDHHHHRSKQPQSKGRVGHKSQKKRKQTEATVASAKKGKWDAAAMKKLDAGRTSGTKAAALRATVGRNAAMAKNNSNNRHKSKRGGGGGGAQTAAAPGESGARGGSAWGNGAKYKTPSTPVKPCGGHHPMRAPCCHGWPPEKQQRQGGAQNGLNYGDSCTSTHSQQSERAPPPTACSRTGSKMAGASKQCKHAVAASGAGNWMTHHMNAVDYENHHRGAQMSAMKHKGPVKKRCGAPPEGASSRRYRGGSPTKRQGRAGSRQPGATKKNATSQRGHRGGQKRWASGAPTLEIRKARQRRASGASMMNLSNNANSGRIHSSMQALPVAHAGVGSGWCVIL